MSSGTTVHSGATVPWSHGSPRLSSVLSRSFRRPSMVAPWQQSDVKNKVRKIAGHTCGLPQTEDRIHYVITDGFCVLFRRSFRKWLSVCPSDPESKKYLKSSALIESEHIRHFTRHIHMIHPFSRGRFFWEMLMIPVLLMLFYLIPMAISATVVPWYEEIWKLILDFLSLIDIILFFFTGYYDIRRQVVILNGKAVVKHYILTFFFSDVVSSLPYSLMMRIFKIPYGSKYQVVKLLLLFKIVRLPTLTRYMRRFTEHTNFGNNYIKFISFMMWIWILIKWTTCLLYGIYIFESSRMLKESDERVDHLEHRVLPPLMTAYTIVRAFMTVGIGECQNLSDFTMIYQIMALLCGSVLNVVILAKIMQVYQRKAGSRNKYTGLVDEINEYMKYKELPTRLKEKVFKYVDFKFQRHIFREDELLQTLSPKLKEDIVIHTCQRMIETVEFFKDLPPRVMLRLVKKLRSEIHLPNDVIVMAGHTGNAMYFIYTGTVAIYTKNGKEICHLEDGSHFGEIALVYNEPRVATVVAVRECEVFRLNRKDFQEAIEPFPELTRKIREQAMTRMEKTMKMTQDTQSLLAFDKNIDDIMDTPRDTSTSVLSKITV